MAILPQTTPAPNPIVIFMPGTSTADSAPAPAEPKPSPLPPLPDRTQNGDSSGASDASSKPSFSTPKLRLEIRDLAHPGASAFLSAVNASSCLSRAVSNVQRLLYKSVLDPHTNCPPTRSVTVILRDMDGVAYTTGSELDDDHKEIHFSMGYIAGIAPSRAGHEITGVLTHELVHCYQWNANGSCPGGLIEGIADWVRLNCDLSPPHWKRETAGKWDRGYQHTAYFLDYLEGRFGAGTVRRMNEKLRLDYYEEKRFWTELLGRPVEQLWQDYAESITGEAGVLVGKQVNGETVDEGTQT